MAKKFYTVVRGAETGIFTAAEFNFAWVVGYPDVLWKGFNFRTEAEQWFAMNDSETSTKSETDYHQDDSHPSDDECAFYPCLSKFMVKVDKISTSNMYINNIMVSDTFVPIDDYHSIFIHSSLSQLRISNMNKISFQFLTSFSSSFSSFV
ncbi:hypothetical protein RCL1_008993 [Eukaryota sp. TZLM3-RCL]